MSIYWMKAADVYPDSGWHENAFMAFDPEVRFPRFHMVEGDETIGNVHLIEGGQQSGQWQWSMTVSLPGPRSSTIWSCIGLTRSRASGVFTRS
ncbi:hypothetical protein [Microvirga sp. VF16]|uniref:hypothetical protein n=1 Tax=Microvirga sp. VF16 TaxID=2807101 RepID=UPI001FEE7043|nr:hypothetical protein [Microvirga sp. VF16]